MANLGSAYGFGYCRLAKDDAAAASWYTRAADLGGVVAQFNLGVLYRDGSGVEQDRAEALRRSDTVGSASSICQASHPCDASSGDEVAVGRAPVDRDVERERGRRGEERREDHSCNRDKGCPSIEGVSGIEQSLSSRPASSRPALVTQTK